MFDFNNKKVLVTGAGIGSAVAKAFYQVGAKVGLNKKRSEKSGSSKNGLDFLLFENIM